MYRPRHITVLIMAVVVGGLRLPVNIFLRIILSSFSLTPNRLAMNSYRIINAVYELKMARNLDIEVCDIFRCYFMSSNKKSNRWFLSIWTNIEHLIEHLPDSDQWANDYIEVFDNYNFAIGDRDRLYPLSTSNRIQKCTFEFCRTCLLLKFSNLSPNMI